ncbi:hypothetical protein D049_2348B, partial [Vibrio parahaemolyticus VPTS-2010]
PRYESECAEVVCHTFLL